MSKEKEEHITSQLYPGDSEIREKYSNFKKLVNYFDDVGGR